MTLQRIIMAKTAGFSMWPFLKAEDILIIKKVQADNLKIGDLIVFNNISKSQVVHRLVRKIKTENNTLLYLTKGDANVFFDHPIDYVDIVGKVFFVEKANKFGATKLINLDNWFYKKLNFLIAIYNFVLCKSHCFLRRIMLK